MMIPSLWVPPLHSAPLGRKSHLEDNNNHFTSFVQQSQKFLFVRHRHRSRFRITYWLFYPTSTGFFPDYNNSIIHAHEKCTYGFLCIP
jgi:hypothetical protein